MLFSGRSVEELMFALTILSSVHASYSSHPPPTQSHLHPCMKVLMLPLTLTLKPRMKVLLLPGMRLTVQPGENPEEGID